jgi:pimeloyl-ACP methyl ester carboxylesterase
LAGKNGGETIHFDGDGVRLAASAWGDPRAHPVLFFHGHGQTRRIWSIAAQVVAKGGYRALSIDLRGHGDSDWAPDRNYAIEAYGRDIVRVIDQLDRRVSMVGVSRGGWVAHLAAAWRPDNTRLLVLCDMAPNISIEAPRAYRRFFDLSRRGYRTLAEAAEDLRAHLGYAVANPAQIRGGLRERDGLLHWHWDPASGAPEHFEVEPTRTRLVAEVRDLRCPVVLLRSGQNSMVTDEKLREFKALTPQLIVEEAPGLRHILTLRDNPWIGRRVIDHLRAGLAAPPDSQVREKVMLGTSA